MRSIRICGCSNFLYQLYMYSIGSIIVKLSHPKWVEPRVRTFGGFENLGQLSIRFSDKLGFRIMYNIN